MKVGQILTSSLVALLLATSCGSDGASPSETTAPVTTTAPPETTEAPDIGAAEKADLTIGIRIPNVGSNAPLFVGIDQGFYADEGLTVEIIETESVREGLVGGSLDFALAESMDVVDAASIGVPISIVAGYRNRQPFYVATHSSIGSPEDLAGKDILLGGTPGSLDYDLRAGVMAENGYDISGVDVNPVSVPGGSNAWVELLLEGELDMTVFFARHKPSIVDAGHNVVLDVFKEWPNDSIAAADDFVASNPNTTARFIRATLRAMEFWMDPSNQDAVQAMAPNYGFNPKDAEKDPAVYGEDLALYDVDMGLDPAAFDEALGKLVDLGAFDSAPAMGTYTNLDALHAAQDALGIAQRPTAAEVAASTGVAAAPDLGAAEKADLTIGIRIPNVGSNAPLFVGIDQGFYADEGLTVEIIETESVREGLVGGSLDFALAESMDVVDAASIGVPISIVAGYRNRQPFYVATHSSIGSPEDLAGKDILLGGTPGSLDYDLRAGVMAENGYDISGVDVNPVSVPGGSNAWVELLLEGELDMTVFFARHKPSIVDAGHNVVLDVFKEWPNDSIAAADDFVASNPNTTARFIRATLRAMEFWMDPSNQDAVQAMAPNYGFNPKDAEKDPAVYGEDLALYDVDMGLDPAAFDEALGKLVDLGAFDSAPAMGTYTNLDALHAAQDALGIAQRPTAAEVAASTGVAAAPDLGAAEKADLTIGIRIPNVGSNAPLFVGIDQGFYADEGLTVEIIETESVREGLVGGSLDFALAESMDVVDAASIGVPISIVAGYRNRQPFYVATHSSIGSPEDLAGKDILLGGTPGSLDYDLRAGVMAENGYDISGVDVNPVSVPGGSNAWVELLLEGELDMTVFFARHKPSIVDAGHNVVLDVFKEWPNDSIAAADDFVASNPNTTARFIRATLRAMEFWMDPSNQDAVQAMAPNYGFNPKDAEKDPAVYGEDLALYDVDMGLDPAAFDEALGKLVDLGAFDSAPAMGTYTNLDALHAAQDALGIAQRPTAAEVAASTGVAAAPDLGAAEKADLTIGIRIPNVGSNAPLFVGIDQGFYADEGLTVEIIETESVREGLVGGSLDFALAESMDVVDAASIGVPISIVAGYRNRQPFYVATHSSIGSPEDLAGKDILLGGTPGSLDYDLRAGVMAENGYDISGVDVNPVSVPGGSNAWVELLLEGELDMTVFFARHKPSIVDAGHNVVLDVFKEWPNDSIAAADDFVASNPNTTARFIRATLRAMEFWMDPSNQDAVQAMAPNYGFNPKDAEKDPAVYGEDLALYDVDMGLDPAAFDEALGKLVDLGAFDSAPAFDTYTDLDALHAAQDALGIARR